jgi:hypothetical protein
MNHVDKILHERQPIHGEYGENARGTWELLRVLQRERNWPILTDQQKHAMYMISTKMARILSGDADALDHWDDIAGYARCVADRLRNPIEPFDGRDVYASLAVAWNIPLEEAKVEVQKLLDAKANGTPAQDTMRQEFVGRGMDRRPISPPKAYTPPKPEPETPGTPEDGGHHADALTKDLEAAIARLKV